MDEIDRASELELQQRERALQARLEASSTSIGSTHCLDCDEPIPAARREAIPGVNRCLDCQQLHEFRGRK